MPDLEWKTKVEVVKLAKAPATLQTTDRSLTLVGEIE